MSVTLDLRSRSAQVLKDQEKVTKNFKEMAKGAGGTTKELDRMERAAKAAAKQMEAPQERYNRKLKETSLLLKTQRISQDQAKGAIAKYNQELRLAETGGKKAFGQQMVTRIAGVASAYVGIGAALQLVSGTLQRVNQQSQEAADALVARARPLGDLLQLTVGDPRAREKVLGSARQTFREGTFEEFDDAARLSFQLTSAGALDERRFFSQLNLVTDSGELAGAGSKVRGAFGNKRLQDVVDQSIAAAANVTDANATQIAQAVAEASESARKLGFGSEETFAAVALTAARTKQPAQAGTQVRALFDVLARQGFADNIPEGRSLADVVTQIRGRGLSNEQLAKSLGSTEALKAFASVQDTRSLQGEVLRIRQADRGELGQQLIRDALGVKEIQLAVNRRRLAAEEEFGTEGLGGARERFNQFLQAEENRQRRRGAPEFAIQTGRFFAEKVGEVLGPKAGLQAGEAFTGQSLERFERQMNLMEQQTDLLEEIKQNQAGRPPVVRNVGGRQE